MVLVFAQYEYESNNIVVSSALGACDGAVAIVNLFRKKILGKESRNFLERRDED